MRILTIFSLVSIFSGAAFAGSPDPNTTVLCTGAQEIDVKLKPAAALKHGVGVFSQFKLVGQVRLRSNAPANYMHIKYVRPNTEASSYENYFALIHPEKSEYFYVSPTDLAAGDLEKVTGIRFTCAQPEPVEEIYRTPVLEELPPPAKDVEV